MKTFSLLLTWYLTTLWFLVFSVFFLTFISSQKVSSLNLVPHYQYYKALPSNGSARILGASTQTEQVISLAKEDARFLLLNQFFKSHKSNLVDYSKKFIDSSDKNSIDYRLLPAIAVFENSAKRNYHNPFGYLDEDQHMVKFDSMDAAIEKLSTTIKTDYFDTGLKTPEEIRTKYPSIQAKEASWSKEINTLIKSIK